MDKQPSGREDGVPTDSSSSVGREDYVRKVLEAYRSTPGTWSPGIRVSASQLW